MKNLTRHEESNSSFRQLADPTKLTMESKFRILIIDDNKELSDSLSEVLEGDGFAIETANNGKDAINKSQLNRYDIALVDIKLPDISRTELVNHLVGVFPSMDFILMTADADLSTAMESVKHEYVISYELKPLDTNHLLSTLNQVAKGRM
ncbi:MAG: response regulator [Candidatus Scalindua sp.]|jgi:DNA-binding NtrC family response regulator|nr:response regulator [Candidatus Scalindua sp.]MBT5303969.1 response regulator [Candidatus Scalindua sp.]MBT6050067.1 response regulator [Candidatus Scalindua sp.]MBT6231181.1 response regulator [Candidatus Scalindua sp.]MBT7212690.1 response regulator [Candidatus Scalindua sp.]